MKKVVDQTKVAIVGGGPVGLLLSKLLSNYGVHHYLIERRKGNRLHPQAHYLNVRSMEIMRSTCWREFEQSLKQSPPSFTWRDFVYGYNVTSAPFVREDQFKNIPAAFWDASPTSILHLAQHTFESILLENSSQSNKFAKSLFGYQADLHHYDHDKCILDVKSLNPSAPEDITLHCDYVIAADGAHSPIRNKLHIQMEGNPSIQNLMNIHFVSPGLHKLLGDRPGMLYFIFNKAMVAVFVSHDIRKDEWVCQIPYFPPYQHPSDFTEQRVHELLEQTLFRHKELKTPIKLLQISHWTMNAQVASDYIDPKHQRIALVGDAAHRFPPAGGFGMNTGLQDAHNLAWKLASAIHSESNSNDPKDSSKQQHWAMQSYHTERKKVAVDNTIFAIHNFQNTMNTASALGLNPEYAKMAQQTIELNALQAMLPFMIRKNAFLTAIRIGLSSLQLLQHWKENPYGKLRVHALQGLIERQESLSLIFPKEDIGFVYSTDHTQTRSVDAASTATSKETPSWHFNQLVEGIRIPHAWLLLADATMTTSSSFTKQLQDTLLQQPEYTEQFTIEHIPFPRSFFISTIDLADIVYHRVKQSSNTAGPPLPLMPILLHDPSLESIALLLTTIQAEMPAIFQRIVLVIVHSSNHAATVTMQQKVHTLLSVHQHTTPTAAAPPSTASSTAAPCTHETLQKALQYPLYAHAVVPDRSKPLQAAEESQVPYYESHYLAAQKEQEIRNLHRENYVRVQHFLSQQPLDEVADTVPIDSSEGDDRQKKISVKVMEVYDVSNKWEEILTMEERRYHYNTAQYAYRWVAVRPDGHLAGLSTGTTKESIAQLVKKLQCSLGLQ